MKNLKVLVEEREDIVRSLVDLASTVEKEGRAFTPEEKEKADSGFARQQELEAEIETIKRANDIKALNHSVVINSPKSVSSKKLLEKEGLAFRGWVLNNNHAQHLVKDEMKQAAYDLGMSLHDNTFMFRDSTDQQTTGTDSEGGHLHSRSVFAGIDKALQWYGGITSVCKTLPSATGNPSFWATVSDVTNNADELDELEEIVQEGVVFGSVPFEYHKVGSGVFPVSNELMTDAEVPVDSLIQELIGERIARKVNLHTTVGDLTNDKGFMKEATNGVTKTDSNSEIIVADLINLQKSVDVAYRSDPSCHWYMNDATHGALMQILDGNDRPLLIPDYQSGNLDRLLGKPILICNEMADIGVGTYPIAFGPASKYLFRPVRQVSFTVLRELYAAFDATGFIATFRCAGRLLNTSAIKTLRMKTS